MFYTYVWKDASGVPFYVGKGSGNRLHNTHNRSAEFKAIHSQGGCAVEIVDEFILDTQASAHEMELVAFYGRREFGGLLVNKTDGGDGALGYFHTADSRAKISAANKGKVVSPETLAKMRIAASNPSLETRAKIGAGRRWWRPSAETRARMSLASRNPSAETRARMSKSRRLAGPRTGDFKGVTFSEPSMKWMAQITIDGKNNYLGRFVTAEAAAQTYDAAALEAWGFDCYLNFPERMQRSA